MNEDGFSIVEALVATVLVTLAAVSLAQALAVSSRVNAAARSRTLATLLVVDKMEQLRSVEWEDAALQPSPPDALVSDTPQYVEYLDARGASVADPFGMGGPPAGTVYVRRWSVEPAQASVNVLALQVVVIRWPDRGGANTVRMTGGRVRVGS